MGPALDTKQHHDLYQSTVSGSQVVSRIGTIRRAVAACLNTYLGIRLNKEVGIGFVIGSIT